MRDELDMIPIIMFRSEATKEDYKQREQPHLLSVENTDEDVMSVNLFGPEYDYQFQVKVSSLMKLMQDKGIKTDE